MYRTERYSSILVVTCLVGTVAAPQRAWAETKGECWKNYNSAAHSVEGGRKEMARCDSLPENEATETPPPSEQPAPAPAEQPAGGGAAPAPSGPKAAPGAALPNLNPKPVEGGGEGGSSKSSSGWESLYLGPSVRIGVVFYKDRPANIQPQTVSGLDPMLQALFSFAIVPIKGLGAAAGVEHRNGMTGVVGETGASIYSGKFLMFRPFLSISYLWGSMPGTPDMAAEYVDKSLFARTGIELAAVVRDIVNFTVGAGVGYDFMWLKKAATPPMFNVTNGQKMTDATFADVGRKDFLAFGLHGSLAVWF